MIYSYKYLSMIDLNQSLPLPLPVAMPLMDATLHGLHATAPQAPLIDAGGRGAKGARDKATHARAG